MGTTQKERVLALPELQNIVRNLEIKVALLIAHLSTNSSELLGLVTSMLMMPGMTCEMREHLRQLKECIERGYCIGESLMTAPIPAAQKILKNEVKRVVDARR